MLLRSKRYFLFIFQGEIYFTLVVQCVIIILIKNHEMPEMEYKIRKTHDQRRESQREKSFGDLHQAMRT